MTRASAQVNDLVQIKETQIHRNSSLFLKSTQLQKRKRKKKVINIIFSTEDILLRGSLVVYVRYIYK